MQNSRSTTAWLIVVCLMIIPIGAVAGDRFTVNGDGTITDHQLGLMWSEFDNQGDINWQQATRWVQYTFGDTLAARHEGWRLPTLEEVKSLYLSAPGAQGNRTDCGMTIHITPEFHLSCGWVWTSDEASISAMGFHFDSGWFHKDRKVLKKGYRALPVRDLK